VCRVCADELDRHYLILGGLYGGTVAKLFHQDRKANRVPKSSRAQG
jgi:hypothetical protein